MIRSLIRAFALLMLLSAAATLAEPLRLHVIANSGSPGDQQVKLAVRDAVLECTAGVADCVDQAEAYRYIRERLPEIEAAAEDTLRAEGFDYGAAAELGVSPFPARSYGGVLYPEGDYTALRIVLGEGAGENWWCVVFPPLCLVDAAGEDVEYRSWLVDVLFGSAN